MDYMTAVKQVQSRKAKDNFLMIEMYYNMKFILPYKEGIAVMSALVNAEQLAEDYGKPSRINPMGRDSIKTTIMSCEEYENHKIAALLNITVDEVKEAAAQAA